MLIISTIYMYDERESQMYSNLSTLCQKKMSFKELNAHEIGHELDRSQMIPFFFIILK